MRHFFAIVIILFLSGCNSPTSKNYQSPCDEKLVDKITSITAQKIEEETGMKLCGIGGGGANNRIRKLNMAFNCYNVITFEQGRELLVYCVNEYLSAINANEEVGSSLTHFPFTTQDIEIIIYLHEKDRRDVPIGALSVISQAENKIKYKIRQQGPIILKQVYEESYEDATKILASEEPVNKIRKNYHSSCSA